MNSARAISIALFTSLLAGCTQDALVPSYMMGDAAQREKSFPFADRWSLEVSGRDLRKAVGSAIADMDVERVGYETYGGSGYLESDYQGVIGVQPKFGERVLIFWQSIDNQTTLQIRRHTAPRTAVSQDLATRIFGKLGLDITVPPPDGATSQPASSQPATDANKAAPRN